MLVGLSRKAFTGALTGEKTAGERVFGSVGGAVQAALTGAQILRVHDVKATRQALAVALGGGRPRTSWALTLGRLIWYRLDRLEIRR